MIHFDDDILCLSQNATEGQIRNGPILTLPLLTIADPGHPLRDMPVCQVNLHNS